MIGSDSGSSGKPDHAYGIWGPLHLSVLFLGICLAESLRGGACLLVVGGLFHGVVVACRGVALEGFW